ncbi:MAG: histidine ammonia-lyase [Blastocatellia bacterium]|nr:histidine ammonia-lyase [Blastocatellia bacterium]
MFLDGNSLTLDALCRVATASEPVELDPAARERVMAARHVVEQILASGRVVYGINTGFGKLSDVTIPPEELRALQLNLVRSHSVGIGQPLSEAESRALVLLRANVLAKGHSGVRPEVLETLCQMLNRGVHPVIPEKGSVGASGDLAPLSHLALVTIGEGEAFYQGERLPGAEALRRAEITPLVLEAKEGLALLNGTQALTGVGALTLARLQKLATAADMIGALTLDALHGTDAAFDPRIHTARPHSGQTTVATHLRNLLAGSEIRSSHKDCRRVQDAYSLRCIPQVHGAVRDVIDHTRQVVEIEFNSATDNPLVFPDTGEVISGGNFHGEPVAFALDYAAIAAAELGAISERRIERLVNPDLSELPAFLTPHAGTCSGLMIVQVAAVSLCAENKILAHPASVDSLPTSANKEDHVSMGMTAALKFRTITDNVAAILAMELLAAAQALEFLRPQKSSPVLEKVHAFVRTLVPKIETDVVLSTHIETLKCHLEEVVRVAEG